MAFFSGSDYLDSTFEPISDRLEDYEEEETIDELRASSELLVSGLRTLEEIGYSFNHAGGLVLHSKMEKVEAVFLGTKLPPGSTVPKLANNECNICFTEADPEELVTTSCEHKYCRDCMALYLHLQSGDLKNLKHTRSKIEQTEDGQAHLRITQPIGVVCPHPTCARIIEGEEFRSLALEHTIKRFEDLSTTVSLEHLHARGELAKCRMAGCGSYLQNCECTSAECRKKTEAMTRAELKKQISLDFWRLTVWSQSVGAMCCPNCFALIEKNGGCSHMYCRACSTNFDWTNAKRVNQGRRSASLADKVKA